MCIANSVSSMTTQLIHNKLKVRTFFFCFFGAAFWANGSSIVTSSNSQPVFTPESSADRELEQIEADTLGTDLPLTEPRLSTDCTLSLNEAFSEVLENSSDKLSFRPSADLSSKFSSKFSFGFSPESSTKLSSDPDVDWKRKQGKVLFFSLAVKKKKDYILKESMLISDFRYVKQLELFLPAPP